MLVNKGIVSSTSNTTKGFLVERIEIRVTFEGKECLSGIIRSDKKYDDNYVSWDCQGKNPTIKSYGDLILNKKES